jgi:hypothetical protein
MTLADPAIFKNLRLFMSVSLIGSAKLVQR